MGAAPWGRHKRVEGTGKDFVLDWKHLAPQFTRNSGTFPRRAGSLPHNQLEPTWKQMKRRSRLRWF